MKIIQLKCPSCGSALEAEDNLETFYCKYCGQKIILSEQSNAAVGAKMLKNILDHRERMYERKAEEERIRREEELKERKRNDKIVLFGILGFLLLAALFITLAIIAGQKGL